MFSERLREIAGQIDDVRALALVARDGIPVEWTSSDPDLDLELLSAELLSQIRAMSQNHQELSVGAVRQFTVTTDRLNVIVNHVQGDYFLILVQGAGASQGRARFELRRAVLTLEQDLA